MVPVTPDTTLDELLTAYPAAAHAFVNHGMACVGCTMARFDTVGQAAVEYRLDIMLFVQEISHLCEVTETTRRVRPRHPQKEPDATATRVL
jgi:hybrid cluster-associated redox disulfide protein